jgi:hypothetical protein
VYSGDERLIHGAILPSTQPLALPQLPVDAHALVNGSRAIRPAAVLPGAHHVSDRATRTPRPNEGSDHTTKKSALRLASDRAAGSLREKAGTAASARAAARAIFFTVGSA